MSPLQKIPAKPRLVKNQSLYPLFDVYL